MVMMKQMRLLIWVLAGVLLCDCGVAEVIKRGVPADLVTPPMTRGEPGPGRRVRQIAPEYAGTEVHHALYLPVDWKPGRIFPVLVEYTGNHSPRHGSTGRVGDANLGFGLSGGKGVIWVTFPYVSEDRKGNALIWWGNREATIEYCQRNLPRICREFGGDPERVFICGFSRGAIATSYIGLANDDIAALWRGVITHDHFDGDRRWNYPESDRESAMRRLARLKGRPVLACGIGSGFLRGRPEIARLTELQPKVGEIFDIPEGGVIHPHTDLWMHRESEGRTLARSWLAAQVR
jgi:hypothetical protein